MCRVPPPSSKATSLTLGDKYRPAAAFLAVTAHPRAMRPSPVQSAVAGCGRRASQPPAPVQKGLLSAPVSGWLGVEEAFLLLQYLVPLPLARETGHGLQPTRPRGSLCLKVLLCQWVSVCGSHGPWVHRSCWCWEKTQPWVSLAVLGPKTPAAGTSPRLQLWLTQKQSHSG